MLASGNARRMNGCSGTDAVPRGPCTERAVGEDVSVTDGGKRTGVLPMLDTYAADAVAEELKERRAWRTCCRTIMVSAEIHARSMRDAVR